MRLLFFFIIFSLATPAFSQKFVVNVYMENKVADGKNDTIYFDKTNKLTWSNFKGIPQPRNMEGAATASGFAFNSQSEYDGEKIILDIGINTFFLKSGSWKNPEINSPFHLLHEQHHFNISRIGAENLMLELKKANFTKANFQQLVSSIFDKVYKANDALQNKYDLETKHSLDTKKQEEWNIWITDQIARIKG